MVEADGVPDVVFELLVVTSESSDPLLKAQPDHTFKHHLNTKFCLSIFNVLHICLNLFGRHVEFCPNEHLANDFLLLFHFDPAVNDLCPSLSEGLPFDQLPLTFISRTIADFLNFD